MKTIYTKTLTAFMITSIFHSAFAQFDASIELANLNGNNGFKILGVDVDDWSGRSIARAGDINGDGIDDVIIGAPLTDPNGNDNTGSSYVVFGSDNGFVSDIELSSLNGKNGFTINGININDRNGWSVSTAGDVNGDGVEDIIIGSPYSSPNGNDSSGSSHVVFGSNQGFDPILELSSLDGRNGFSINGVNMDDRSGWSVSYAGDLNNDNFSDIAIGAPNADTNGNAYSGRTYVIFGKKERFLAIVDLMSLDGNNGFVINGVGVLDHSGNSVDYAGDVNGDGIDDLLIGAYSASPNGNIDSGSSYVIFGKDDGFSSTFELSSLNGNNGFAINGHGVTDESGISVSYAGDFNADGIDDVIIGSKEANPNGKLGAGSSYVVFGTDSGFVPNIEVSSLDGNIGFRIIGEMEYDGSGRSVSHAGDVNADGIDDVIIGAFGADPNQRRNAGRSYVVFGSDIGFTPTFELSSLDGSNGFKINGVTPFDESGYSVSGAGDVNGDGIDDIAIGAYRANTNGKNDAGNSYVVFGREKPLFKNGFE